MRRVQRVASWLRTIFVIASIIGGGVICACLLTLDLVERDLNPLTLGGCIAYLALVILTLPAMWWEPLSERVGYAMALCVDVAFTIVVSK